MADFTLHFDEEDYFSIDSSISDNYADFSIDNNYAAFPLSVPQDPIEDIELYPNFVDDPISLSGLDSWWKEYETQQQQQQKTRVMLRKRVALHDCNNVFGNKKQRGKREGRRSAWSITSVTFPEGENHEPLRRKCSHCQTTDTPQWRIGPLGPKTLCNACGVRYKSGRLLPDYRPAASPTFDSNKHSNFHRKILKKKGCDFIGN